MSDSFLNSIRITFTLICVLFIGGVTAYSQESGPTTQAAASAGMTSGLPGGASSTGRQMDMMQVRSSAQSAGYDAAAAQMARSADSAIEERHQQQAIESARETKRLKKDATTRMKWERSANAYNKVSADQMSTWRDRAGNVRVERNVPNAFLLALREEEAALTAQSQKKQKKGFNPFRSSKKSTSSASNPAYQSTGEYKEKGGFMKNLRPPRLPFIGGSKKAASSATVAATNQPPVRVGSNSSTASNAAPVATKVGGATRIPEISGAALVDGHSPVSRTTSSSGAGSSGSTMKKSGDYSSAAQQASVPEFKVEKKRFLFKKKSSSGTSLSGGGFSFGKKKKKSKGHGSVDGSLFPSGASGQAPVAGEVGGGTSATTISSDPVVMQSVATEQLELPGQSLEKKQKRKFTMLKPSIPSLGKSSGGGSKKSKSSGPLTTINANGNSFYRVASQAQFMRYGESQMESEITILPAGVLVRMTNPGTDWATIELNDGTKGVIQVKNLQGISGAAVPPQFGMPTEAKKSG